MLGSGFRVGAAPSVFFSTLARPPPGWCLLFSKQRTLFRSEAEVRAARRPTLGAEELGLADMGFLSTGGVPEGRTGVDAGLTRPGAPPAGSAAPGAGTVLFGELVVVLLERLESAGATFFTSAGLPSVLTAGGLLGRAAGGLLPPAPWVTAAAPLGATWALLELGLEAGAEASLGGEARFSGTFASAVGLGFRSLEGKVEGLAVVAVGRLGGTAGTEPEARVMGFLFGPPEVVGAGCLGREVGCVLTFDVEVFAG